MAGIRKQVKQVLNSIPALLLAGVCIALIFCSCEKTSYNEYEATFIKTHKVEGDSLFLTDRISDFIPLTHGYALAERNRSTILLLDDELVPIRRIGSKGDGPDDLKFISALLQMGDSSLAILDEGHKRVVFMDIEGKIKGNIRSEPLSHGTFNFLINKDILLFTVPEKDESIMGIDLLDGTTQTWKHQVHIAKNEHHRYQANRAFLKNFDDKYFHFSPTELYVELLSSDFKLKQRLDLSHLPLWKVTQKRIEKIYASTTNQTIRNYSDLYQDGASFYMLAYLDIENSNNESGYSRIPNHLVHIVYDPSRQEMSLKALIKLSDEGYYTQVIVDKNRVLAFNLRTFFIDEYELLAANE